MPDPEAWAATNVTPVVKRAVMASLVKEADMLADNLECEKSFVIAGTRRATGLYGLGPEGDEEYTKTLKSVTTQLGVYGFKRMT